MIRRRPAGCACRGWRRRAGNEAIAKRSNRDESWRARGGGLRRSKDGEAGKENEADPKMTCSALTLPAARDTHCGEEARATDLRPCGMSPGSRAANSWSGLQRLYPSKCIPQRCPGCLQPRVVPPRLHHPPHPNRRRAGQANHFDDCSDTELDNIRQAMVQNVSLPLIWSLRFARMQFTGQLGPTSPGPART